MNIKQRATNAKAEQLYNMESAATVTDAYWAGSLVESVRLHYQHGAFRKIKAAKAETRRRNNAAIKAAMASR